MSLPVIVPSTDLRAHQSAVREAADKHTVYVTDNGGKSYTFCPAEHFDEEETLTEDQESYDQRIARILERGRADIAAGRYVVGIEAAREYVRQIRAQNG